MDAVKTPRALALCSAHVGHSAVGVRPFLHEINATIVFLTRRGLLCRNGLLGAAWVCYGKATSIHW